MHGWKKQSGFAPPSRASVTIRCMPVLTCPMSPRRWSASRSRTGCGRNSVMNRQRIPAPAYFLSCVCESKHVPWFRFIGEDGARVTLRYRNGPVELTFANLTGPDGWAWVAQKKGKPDHVVLVRCGNVMG